MQLTPNEIDIVEEAGVLDEYPVKLIRTKGGFWIAVGKPKGKLREEALAAGSHPAIVKYNLEKQYPKFQPSLMKSEYLSDGSIVDKHSHFLTQELRKSGHDVYSVQNGNEIDFHITKHNVKVNSISGRVDNDVLVINKLDIDKQFTRALAGATTEKALACGAKKVRIGDK